MKPLHPQSARHPRRALPAGITVAAATVLMSLLLLTSCGGGGAGGPSPPPAAPLAITTVSLLEGTLGQPYATSLEATGGTLPYTWSLASGSGPLPPDLTLSSTGTINGNATANGTYNFSVQVRDSRGSTTTRGFTISVRDPLVIPSATMPSGVQGREFSFTFEATGGLAPYTWALNGGRLPQGLTLDAGGVLSGTPTSYGNFSFTVRVEDNADRRAYSSYNLSVVGALAIVTSSLPDINVGWNPELQLHWVGGCSPLEWGLATGSGPLPEGMTITYNSSYAAIRGTPTQAGNYTFTVQVTDSCEPPQVATRELSLLVENHLYVRVTRLPTGVVGRPYEATLEAYGGTPPYTWRLSSGTLPAGLTLDPASGQITGVPEEPADHSTLRIEVTDSSNPVQTAWDTFGVLVNPPVAFVTAILNDAVQGINSNNLPVQVQWGLPPQYLRVVSGTLPSGLTLDSGPSQSGIFFFTGTPTTVGESRFTLEASDSSTPPTVATKEFSMRVVTQLELLTTSLPEGLTGDFYSAALSAEGGVPPYSWWLYEYDRLPGLTFDRSSGTLSGIPTSGLDRSLYFSVTDSTNPPQVADNWLRLHIIARLFVATTRLPPERPDVPYTVKLGLTGGTAPYSWSITSGNLPEGLIFDATTWEIYGTPTVEGTFDFTVQVTDTGPPVQTASKALSLMITSDLGRNDSPETATPISNGTFRASISPYAEPVAGPANPDHDYYTLTANPGAIVKLETMAKRLTPPSPLDTVLEIVDAAGNRLSTCFSPYGYFDGPCINDDMEQGIVQDSRMEFQVPDSASEPVTIFVRVLSWDGSARPDYIYDLIVSGAN